MSNPLARAQNYRPADRRLYYRQPFRSLAYVELDEGNGGIVLNISEGGLSVQAYTSVIDDVLPEVRFQLSESEGWIHANARVSWTSESRKLAGLEFVDLPDDARLQIKEWLIREALLPRAAPEEGATSTPKENEPSVTPPDTHKSTVSNGTAGEPAFPSEDRGQVAAANAEFGTPPRAAPTPGVFSYPAPDAFARILGRSREYNPNLSGQSADEHPAGAEKLFANRLAAAAVLLLLAVASLAAGWSTGHGEVGKRLREFLAMASQNGEDTREPTPSPAIPAARPTEIEVVSASDQHWTIPFDGPMNGPADATHQQVSENGATHARKPQTNFQTWVLAPPQQSRPAATDGGVAKENPPVLPDVPAAGTDGALTTSGAINSHALAGAPSLRVPEPSQPAGIVKQGQLIRRIDPEYPTIARDQRQEGTVRLNVSIGPDGAVRAIAVLGGPRLLLDAAERAVRLWRYTPTLLDGKPVQFQREVDLTFHLATPSH